MRLSIECLGIALTDGDPGAPIAVSRPEAFTRNSLKNLGTLVYRSSGEGSPESLIGQKEMFSSGILRGITRRKLERDESMHQIRRG